MIFGLAACGDSSKHEGEAKTPSGSSAQKGRDYQDVVNNFKDKGFTNIKTEELADLVTGWIHKEGEVESVSVGGDKDYSPDVWCPNDVEVVITYHTFPKDETESPEPSPTESVIPSASVDEAAIKAAAAKLETSFPVEKAKRSAIVALTNSYATDVFKTDGSTYDTSKFHSFADMSGFYLKLYVEGNWTAKNDNTWHVENLRLATPEDSTIEAALDVCFDGTNYQISNITGTLGNSGSSNNVDISEIESAKNHPYLTVPPNLIADDRYVVDTDTQSSSGFLDKNAAISAFEEYGASLYPYGFKCHWIADLIDEEQSSDGSWYFKVGVTIKNEYGTKVDAVATGIVGGTTYDCSVVSFDVS